LAQAAQEPLRLLAQRAAQLKANATPLSVPRLPARTGPSQIPGPHHYLPLWSLETLPPLWLVCPL
jgi:hypothetical protein